MISFVILNYNSFIDTIECIKTINNIKTSKKISIIVTDNNTLKLKEINDLKEYTNDVILLKENVGFSRGNNIGCKYAIEKYNPDFLCVINSDTLIKQREFIDIIYEKYEEYSFDILGPKILPTYTESVNPFPVLRSINDVNKAIKYRKKLILIYNNIILRNLLNIFILFKKKFTKEKHLVNGLVDETGVALHGCALIFSKKYYEKFSDVFFNETFLFHEEEFLYYRCKKNGLISLYSPDLEIIHKEGQSLEKSYINQKYKKLIFKNKEILKSLYLYRKIIIENKEI